MMPNALEVLADALEADGRIVMIGSRDSVEVHRAVLGTDGPDGSTQFTPGEASVLLNGCRYREAQFVDGRRAICIARDRSLVVLAIEPEVTTARVYDRASVLWIGAETLRTIADMATFYDPDGELSASDVLARRRAELAAIAAAIHLQPGGTELGNIVMSLADLMRERDDVDLAPPPDPATQFLTT